MHKKQKLLFDESYDYIEALRHDYRYTSHVVDFILRFGYDLIEKNKSTEFDDSVYMLDEQLHVLSLLVMGEVDVFAFKGNECFYKHFGFDTKNKNNGFYVCSMLNNFKKHLDIEKDDFYRGNLKPRDYMSKEAIEELDALSLIFHQNVENFKKYIKKNDFEINKAKGRKNVENNKDMLKKYFQIETYDEYYALIEKYYPTYFGYVIKLVKPLSDSYTGDRKLFRQWFVNTIKNIPISSEIKEKFIANEGNKFKNDLYKTFSFLVFVLNNLVESCGPADPITKIHDCKKMFYSEFSKHLDNLGGGYESTKIKLR